MLPLCFCSSPFFDKLPIELRKKIYKHALSPLVNFSVSYKGYERFRRGELRYSREGRGDIDESYDGEESEKSENDYDSEDSDNSKQDDDEDELDEDDLYSQSFTISTRLSCSTPSLFLVSKSVAFEIEDIVAFINTTIKSSLVRHKTIRSPTPQFLALCEQSRFVFNGGSEFAISFLHVLPKRLSASIRFIIPSGCLFGDDYPSRKAWSKPEGGHTPFAASLRSNMQNLQEVSIFVLTQNTDYYCSYGPLELCDMLADGTIDVVRFLMAGLVEADYVSQDNSFTSPTLRPEFENFVDDESDAEYHKRSQAADAIPDKFLVTHESEPSNVAAYAGVCDEGQVKSIFRLTRRPEEG